MSKTTVKLTKTELDLVTAIQTKKQELLKLYQSNLDNLNQNEAIVIQLIMDRADIVEAPSKIDIEGESLVFEFSETSQEEPKKKTKTLK